MRIKDGVNLSKLSPKIWEAAVKFELISWNIDILLNVPPTITCGNDKRKKFSYHDSNQTKTGFCEAVDFRAKLYKTSERAEILKRAKELFKGTAIQIILHGEGDNIHFHIEHDLKLAEKIGEK